MHVPTMFVSVPAKKPDASKWIRRLSLTSSACTASDACPIVPRPTTIFGSFGAGRAKFGQLILIADRKYVSSPAFDQEFSTLLKEARENQKVVEINRPCPECKCDDRRWHNIYDYQDKEARIRTDRPVYARGKKVSFTVTNTSNFSRYFSIVSAEKLINGEWKEVIWDAVCGCRKYCDTLGFVVDPGKAVTMSWDQSIMDMDNGCVNAPAYPYRFVISDLYGAKDKGECETYHSVIYSNVFQIRE